MLPSWIPRADSGTWIEKQFSRKHMNSEESWRIPLTSHRHQQSLEEPCRWEVLRPPVLSGWNARDGPRLCSGRARGGVHTCGCQWHYLGSLQSSALARLFPTEDRWEFGRTKKRQSINTFLDAFGAVEDQSVFQYSPAALGCALWRTHSSHSVTGPVAI